MVNVRLFVAILAVVFLAAFAVGLAFGAKSSDSTIHIDDHPAYACIGDDCP